MTSRISFSKLFKEELKHHLVSVFAAVVCFLGEALFFFFNVQSIVEGRLGEEANWTIRALASEAEPVFTVMIPTMILAVVLAAEYFSYLHSRRRTDFQMSLPIQRRTQFWLGAAVCMTIFLIPCLIAGGIEILTGYATGYANHLFLTNMIWRIVCQILAFVAMWITMALAMIMTGNLAVAVLGLGAFCSYIPLFLKNLLPTFQGHFYETYVYLDAAELWYYFSPVTLIAKMAGRYFDWSFAEHMPYMAGIVIYTFIVGAAVYYLYMKRPSEAAGRAMSFEKWNTPIRFAIVIPLALYCGYFFSVLSGFEVGMVWMVIGILLGVLLLHGVVESIFNFDLRKMFSKKKQIVLTWAICLGFIVFLQANRENYNSFVPEEADVESVVFSVTTDSIYFHVDSVEDGKDAGVSGEHVASVLQLVESAVENKDQVFDYADDKVLSQLIVKYQLKNGTVKARCYNTFDDEVEENILLLDSLMATEDFKKDYYDIYTTNWENAEEINYYNGYTSETLYLTDREKQELYEIYKKELTALSFTDMQMIERVGMIEVIDDDDYEYGYGEHYIHANFKETLAFLEKLGVDVGFPLEDAKISSLELYEEYFKDEIVPGVIIRDQEVLESVKDQFVAQFLYGSKNINQLKDSTICHVEFVRDGRHESTEIAIRKDVEQVLRNSIE